MNGAAIGCQDRAHRHLQDNSLNQQNPGYSLEKNHLGRGNFHPLDSKTMSYPSSDSFFVDNSAEFPHTKEHFFSDKRSSINDDDICDPRHVFRSIPKRVPMDLPVPKFVIDKNYVGEPPVCGLNAPEIDLDTRINLLIRSNALSGVHPIFSELQESENSSPLDKPLNRSKIRENRRASERQRHSFDLDDDPNKPLSRPPSPFLSRATYLFWFNKAIEIKEQAKEQEKALLEIASKKLVNNNTLITLTKPVTNLSSKSEIPKPNNSCLLNSLLDEISKELKDAVKAEFINTIIESTALSVLENVLEEKDYSNFCGDRDEGKSEHSLKCSLTTETKTESKGSTSPKVPFPENNVHVEVDMILQSDHSKNNTPIDKSIITGNILKKTSSKQNNNDEISGSCSQMVSDEELNPSSSVQCGSETKLSNETNLEEKKNMKRTDLPEQVLDVNNVNSNEKTSPSSKQVFLGEQTICKSNGNVCEPFGKVSDSEGLSTNVVSNVALDTNEVRMES